MPEFTPSHQEIVLLAQESLPAEPKPPSAGEALYLLYKTTSPDSSSGEVVRMVGYGHTPASELRDAIVSVGAVRGGLGVSTVPSTHDYRLNIGYVCSDLTDTEAEAVPRPDDSTNGFILNKNSLYISAKKEWPKPNRLVPSKKPPILGWPKRLASIAAGGVTAVLTDVALDAYVDIPAEADMTFLTVGGVAGLISWVRVRKSMLKLQARQVAGYYQGLAEKIITTGVALPDYAVQLSEAKNANRSTITGMFPPSIALYASEIRSDADPVNKKEALVINWAASHSERVNVFRLVDHILQRAGDDAASLWGDGGLRVAAIGAAEALKEMQDKNKLVEKDKQILRDTGYEGHRSEQYKTAASEAVVSFWQEVRALYGFVEELDAIDHRKGLDSMIDKASQLQDDDDPTHPLSDQLKVFYSYMYSNLLRLDQTKAESQKTVQAVISFYNSMRAHIHDKTDLPRYYAGFYDKFGKALGLEEPFGFTNEVASKEEPA